MLCFLLVKLNFVGVTFAESIFHAALELLGLRLFVVHEHVLVFLQGLGERLVVLGVVFEGLVELLSIDHVLDLTFLIPCITMQTFPLGWTPENFFA